MRFLNRRRIAILILLILLLIGIETVPKLRGMVSPFLKVSFSLERILSDGVDWVKRPLSGLFFGTNTSEYISELEKQVAQLSVEKTKLIQLEAENSALHKIISLTNIAPNEHLVAARVIGHDPREPQTLLRINRGRSSGVHPKETVVGPNGSLVGIIIEVGDTVSTFRLLRGPNVVIPVRIPGEENSFGLLSSDDGLSLKMSQIPQDGILQVGALVVTNTGLDGILPNIPIGTVMEIVNQPASLWQEAIVAPFTKSRTLDIVSVLTIVE